MDMFAEVTKEQKERGYIEVTDNEIERILFPKDTAIVSRETILDLLNKNNFKESDVTDVYLPDSVIIILDNCFENFPELWTFSVSRETSNLQYIGKSAFAGCKKLYHVDFSNSIRYIGTDAFKGAKVDDINIINLYSKVDYISKDAFGIREITEKRLKEKNNQ